MMWVADSTRGVITGLRVTTSTVNSTVHRCLERVAIQLAIALRCVAVADVEQRPGLRHGRYTSRLRRSR
jgi:hypothetical protein